MLLHTLLVEDENEITMLQKLKKITTDVIYWLAEGRDTIKTITKKISGLHCNLLKQILYQ